MKKKIFSICLSVVVLVALIVVLVPGCDGGAKTYKLTMAADPAAGGTATDETGGSPYEEGADVDIKAVANTGYEFVSWTAPAGAGTFDDANAEETTFTMPAQDVTVTAHFQVEVETLDHATAYWVGEATPPYIEEEVYLEDQFCAVNADMLETAGFAIPAAKEHGDVTTTISNPDHCLTVYWIYCEEEPQVWWVTVNNQFGTQNLTVQGPYGLAVPTQNEGHEAPVGLDHYLLYEVTDYTYFEEVTVKLNDQFLEEPEVYGVYEPMIFANPAQKTYGEDEVTEIVNPDVHAVFYMTDVGEVDETVEVVNQFGEQALEVNGPFGLVVPSEKIDWELMPVPLDHFRMYAMDEGMKPYVGKSVQLEDQFRDEPLDALVGEGVAFCNPCGKWDGYVETPIYHWDYHLTVYDLDCEDQGYWEVVVDNQFGSEQVLTVYGPVALAVPTQKLFPEYCDPPVGLDHFLLYEVVDYMGPPLDIPVELWDQFNWGEEVLVYEPLYFANPVQKTYSGEVTEIENPEAHLVFYAAPGASLVPTVEVWVINQFDVVEQGFTVTWPDGLGVPSEKIYWEPLP